MSRPNEKHFDNVTPARIFRNAFSNYHGRPIREILSQCRSLCCVRWISREFSVSKTNVADSPFRRKVSAVFNYVSGSHWENRKKYQAPDTIRYPKRDRRPRRALLHEIAIVDKTKWQLNDSLHSESVIMTIIFVDVEFHNWHVPYRQTVRIKASIFVRRSLRKTGY